MFIRAWVTGTALAVRATQLSTVLSEPVLSEPVLSEPVSSPR
jgi:hypothetical protein